MMRYIYQRYGHAAETISAKSAVSLLASEGVPNNFAVILVGLAESRCRLLDTMARHAGREGVLQETTIGPEIKVQFCSSRDLESARVQPELPL